MRKRIVVATVAAVVVLGGVGGTVAALGTRSPAHTKTGLRPAAPQPVTAAATAVSTAPTSTTPPTMLPATRATTAPAPEAVSSPAPVAAQTTTTTLAPAIGAPGGSRFGPTGSPTP